MSRITSVLTIAFLTIVAVSGCSRPVCEDEMCMVQAGVFTMGCDSDSLPCRPRHEVTLDTFLMDRTEVTWDAFMSCVDAGVCSHHQGDGKCKLIRVLDENPHLDEYPPYGHAGPQYKQAGMPMTCVDWEQARQYCEWAGKRLPTEAEWEKAARGTDERIFPWGNEAPSCELALGLYDKTDNCGSRDPENVCTRSPAGDSPYGMCDMAGNVLEWVSDWYDRDYYAASPLENPTGPEDGTSRVTRGGAIWLGSYSMTTTRRMGWDPAYSANYLGFRCAKSVTLDLVTDDSAIVNITPSDVADDQTAESFDVYADGADVAELPKPCGSPLEPET